MAYRVPDGSRLPNALMLHGSFYRAFLVRLSASTNSNFWDRMEASAPSKLSSGQGSADVNALAEPYLLGSESTPCSRPLKIYHQWTPADLSSTSARSKVDR